METRLETPTPRKRTARVAGDDACNAVLGRLAQRIEHVSAELRQLVEEEDV